jgi:DNA-binding CsgD family transcriptional regulator
MLPWFDLIAPFLAFVAGLPAVTMALLLWRRTKDRSFELLATGLGLLAVLAFLLSVGIFLIASQLVANPDLRFVLWNTTFLISFVSLVVLRRFTALVVPGPQTVRTFPRFFSAVSALIYGTILVLAFAPTPPLVDFKGRAVYALSAFYYLAGFFGPARRLWRARSAVPSWVTRLLTRGPLVLAPPAVGLVVYEGLRWAAPFASEWPSLGPLAALVFFALVTAELFRILVRGPEASSSGADHGHEAQDRVSRIAARCIAHPLTKREIEVLALLLDGWRNQDIAERLGLSPNTVKNHVYNLYQKTGAANRVELAGLGVSSGESKEGVTG